MSEADTVHVETDTSREHELKCWPPYFEAVMTGRKTFEVRSIEDRHFCVGDTLVLREYDASLEHRKPDTEGYTGRTCRRRVTYVLGDGGWHIQKGFVVLGLAALDSPSDSVSLQEVRERLREIASDLDERARWSRYQSEANAVHDKASFLRSLAEGKASYGKHLSEDSGEDKSAITTEGNIERIAICQHPAGEGVWWRLAGDETGERCVQDCDCAPRVYVSVDAVPPSLQEVRERLEKRVSLARASAKFHKGGPTEAIQRAQAVAHAIQGEAEACLRVLDAAFPTQTEPDQEER